MSSGVTLVVVLTSSRTTPVLNTCSTPITPAMIEERVLSAIAGNSEIQ